MVEGVPSFYGGRLVFHVVSFMLVFYFGYYPLQALILCYILDNVYNGYLSSIFHTGILGIHAMVIPPGILHIIGLYPVFFILMASSYQYFL